MLTKYTDTTRNINADTKKVIVANSQWQFISVSMFRDQSEPTFHRWQPSKIWLCKNDFFTPHTYFFYAKKSTFFYPKKVIVSKVSSLKSLFRHVKIYHNFIRCKKCVKTTDKQLAPDVLWAFDKMTTPTWMLRWPRIKRRPLRRRPISWRLFVGKPLWRLGSGDLHQVSMIYNIIHL